MPKPEIVVGTFWVWLFYRVMTIPLSAMAIGLGFWNLSAFYRDSVDRWPKVTAEDPEFIRWLAVVKPPTAGGIELRPPQPSTWFQNLNPMGAMRFTLVAILCLGTLVLYLILRTCSAAKNFLIAQIKAVDCTNIFGPLRKRRASKHHSSTTSADQVTSKPFLMLM